MARYSFPLRILITLLILTMLLPGWGLLSASNADQETSPALREEAISNLSSYTPTR